MSRRTLSIVLAIVTVAGALARFAGWRLSPGAIHPDEVFQVLEPAWWHITGVGLAAWEWRDGVRSWVLPSYNGAWMALLFGLGAQRGGIIGNFIQLHWALVNLLLIPTAYVGGSHVARALFPRAPAPPAEGPPAGWQGGLVAAILVALFPLLSSYAPHTLSELPSMLCLTGGLALTCRLIDDPKATRNGALLAGAVLSLGVCIRIANGPLVLVPPLWLLLRRRFALFGWLVAGALGPVLFFGLVDLITWGRFLHSYIGYIKFNFIEGRAAQFGVSPWDWYFERLHFRAPIGLPLLLVPLLLGLRGSWPFALSAFGLVALLSTQAHKEERFVVAAWPFALIGAGGVIGAVWARLGGAGGPKWRRVLTHVVGVAAIALVLVDNAARPVREDLAVPRAIFELQAVASRDPKLTALLMDSIFWNGGSTFIGPDVLQISFDRALLTNRLFSHALVPQNSDNDRRAREAGFVPIFSRGDYVLLRRP